LTQKWRARALRLARETLQIEADAIAALNARLDTDDSVGRPSPAARTAAAAWSCPASASPAISRRKIAATLASTGTPAMFVHPAEAAHGDLGMVTADDAFIAISYSGETAELMAIVPIVKRMGAS
jgi:arabinose-5-phosphate isomerase